jgi:hypothetical protein
LLTAIAQGTLAVDEGHGIVAVLEKKVAILQVDEVQRVHFRRPDGSFVLTQEDKPKKAFRQRRPDPSAEVPTTDEAPQRTSDRGKEERRMSNERTTDDVPPHKPRATRFEDFIPRTDDEDDPGCFTRPVAESAMWIGSAWPDWPTPGRRAQVKEQISGRAHRRCHD